MSLLTKKQAGIHENASTQINVPENIAAEIERIGQELIPDEHLAGEGRVTQPHVTVKYGVQPQAELLQRALAGRTSFPISLGNTVVFTNSENNAGGTPVVVEVHGHELDALHDAVMSAMGTLPDDLPYVPHITVAYVKPDEAQHYAGSDAFVGLKFTAEAVALSPYDDSKQVDVPLAKAAATPAQVTPELPQVAPQVPQQQEEEEQDEEVQRDEPATEQPSVAPRQKQPKAPLLKKQPKPYKAPKPPAENKDFKKWFAKSKVTDEDGKPAVVYHGTTHNFDTFDPGKGNVEAYYGKALYFTSDQEDVGTNYATSTGPDLTNRIEQRYEQLQNEVYDKEGEELEEILGPVEEGEDIDAKLKAKAKEEIAGQSGGFSMPVYLSIQNPVYVQKKGGTYFNIEFDEENGTESGNGVDLYNAIHLVAGNFEDSDVDQVWEGVSGDMEFTAWDFEQQVRNTGGFTDPNSGDQASGEFISQVYQELGFDGVVLDAYGSTFFGPGNKGNMKMEYGTKHYIIWNPSKVKSAIGNAGKYDPANPSITAADEKSVGDLGLAKKVMHELMPVLGVQVPEPELKIVNSARAGWLGQDVWGIGIDQTRGIYGKDNTTIHIQRSILNDENTLRRILAHELAHHADNLVNGPKLIEKWQGRDKVHYNMFRSELTRTAHGKGWKEFAQKFNAKYGADFVTEKSDESYVTEDQPLKPYHILLKRDYDGKLAYEASSRISPKMKRQLDRMAQEKDGYEYRLTQTDDRDFYEGQLIGSFYFSRPKEEEKQQKLEALWAKAQKLLPSGAAKEQDDLLALMREKMTGPGWQRPGRRASLLKQAIPQIEELEHGVSKDYDRVAYVYNQMYSAQKPSLSWKDFQKMFPREQNSPLFTQIRQNRPVITLADLDRWLEEYKEKAKEYQNYNLEHSTYKDKATSFRDVEQLVLRINQSASAAEIIGEDEMLRFFLQQAEQGSRQSGHPVGKDTVGWLRVDFVDDNWLLIDEVQSDLINSVELGMKFISEPSLESLMSKYKSETVKQKIRDMGATEQMFQHSKQEFARRGYTMEKFKEMKQSLANLFKDWAEYGIASIIEIARRHGIKNVAIHTGTTIAKRDPDLEADKAVMYYDNLAKSFGFKKQQLDMGNISGEFWTRTASKTAGKRDEAVTSLTFGVDMLNFPSPVLVRWEQGMRWREVLKAVKSIAGEVAEKRIPWGDIHIWASLWQDRQAQDNGWEAEKSKGRVMYDVLHNGSFVRVDKTQPVAMGEEVIEASHKTPPLSDTRYNNPAQGEETNAYANIPERVRGMEELPSLEELAPQMFEKEGGERGPVPEGTTFRTEVHDAPRGQIDAQAQAWLNGVMIGYVNFAVAEVDTELDDTRYWRKQQDEYGADEWERIAEIPEQAWVKYVHVEPQYRRMGIATGMYNQIKADYPGIKITSSGTTGEGGKMRTKMKERGMFASALLQKKAQYAEGQAMTQHTDHTPVGMYKVLKSNPFVEELEALRQSEGDALELNPALPGAEGKTEGQPMAKGEDAIGAKMKQDGGNNVGRISSKRALKLNLDKPSGALADALAEIEERFLTNPMNPKEYMVLNGETPVAVFEVAGRNGKLRLKDIRSLEKNTGGGRAALQAVTAIADKHGVEMELTASPFGDEKTRLDKDQLQEWYRRHEFEDEEGYDPALGYMTRKPKTGAGAVNIDWNNNMFGKFKLTVEHSWHEYGDEIDTDVDVNEDNWNLLVVNAFDTTKKQAGQPGKWVGSAEFVLRHGDLESCNTEVDENYRRQGIATAIYQFAEGFTGYAVAPHNEQSPAGRALWKQKGRPFGDKSASNVVTGEQVVDYVQKQHPSWSREQCYQIVGLDAGGDYILTPEYDLDRLEAGDDYDPTLAQRYAKMKTPLPPIILDIDGNIRDGNHRVAAAKLRGDNHIAAYEPLDTYDPSETR